MTGMMIHGMLFGKVNIDNKGWTAEMRIPFSQMRFKLSKNNIWGINFKRDIKRHNEIDYLSYVPKTESGFVAHFVDLQGLSNIKTQNKLEILPYVTAKSKFTQKEIGNPFNDGSSVGIFTWLSFIFSVDSNPHWI